MQPAIALFPLRSMSLPHHFGNIACLVLAVLPASCSTLHQNSQVLLPSAPPQWPAACGAPSASPNPVSLGCHSRRSKRTWKEILISQSCFWILRCFDFALMIWGFATLLTNVHLCIYMHKSKDFLMLSWIISRSIYTY